MKKWKHPGTLNHSDLRLKNVLVDPDSGKITAILDWDDAKSAVAPFWELSLALHDLTIDERHAFLEGYGLTPKEFRDIAWGVKTVNILNYAETTQWYADDKNEKGLEDYRTRLNGHFDLYSL
jgi:hygromycin-B 4-O-kinase